MADALGGLWNTFIEYLFTSGAIRVPDDFHSRCNLVDIMMDNEVTGIVSTVTNYAINSAKEAELSIECGDQTIEDLLNQWLTEINIKVNGIPTGIKELAEEYYKERWTGSSLCLMKVGKWKSITIGKNTIKVPTVLWFVNGASVWIKRPNEKSGYKLGTDKFYLDEFEKIDIIKENENMVLQKPFARWFTKYPSPYLIKTGVYKNWKAFEVLQNKSDEVISKFIPYLFTVKKGTIEGLKEGVKYDDTDMQEMVDVIKEQFKKYEAEKGKLPINAHPFDQEYSHLIPDLTKILSEQLYNQGSRAILCGLGFIDVIQGISSTRKESILNPKPFIAEVNAGVSGFKSMLMDIVGLIIDANSQDHRKLFSENNDLKIVNSPLKINVETIIDALRSAFVYGSITIETYQEILGVNPEQEYERMVKEWKVDPRTGLNRRELFYAHITQNTEDKGTDSTHEEKPAQTKKQIEKQKEKMKGVEKVVDAEQVINVPLDPTLDTEIAPYQNVEDLLKHQPSLKKYPLGAQKVFMEVWNSIYKETNDEARAFQGAWSQLKKWMSRHNKTK